MSQMPLAFTNNKAQRDERALLRPNADNAKTWIDKERTYYQFSHRILWIDPENFSQLNSEELLAKMAALSMYSWNYRDSAEWYIRPVAEDFVGAFGVGTVLKDCTVGNNNLSPGDASGVTPITIRELDRPNKRIEQLEQALTSVKAMLQEVMVG